MKHLDSKMKTKVQNNVIKSIATSTLNKNIIFDCTYALYELLSANIEGDNNDRVLTINDIDIDTFNVINEIWDDGQGKKKLKSFIEGFIKEKIVSTFGEHYFKDIKVITDLDKISKFTTNGRPVFKTSFALDMIDVQTELNFELKINLLFVKDPYPYFSKIVTVDNEQYEIMVYEVDKYHVGKMYSLVSHYHKYIAKYGDEISEIKHRYPKIINIYKDLEYIRRFYPFEWNRISYFIDEFHREGYPKVEDFIFYFIEVFKKLQKEFNNDKSEIR